MKHGQVRWKVHKAKTSYQVPGYDNFVFGYIREEPGELIESGQAILDEKGRTELEFPLDRQVLAGESGYLVIATVVDFDGRAASNSKNYQVEPDYLVGFGSHPEEVQAEVEQVLKVDRRDPGRQKDFQGADPGRGHGEELGLRGQTQ